MQTKSPTSVLSILVSYGRSSDFIRLFSTTTVASKRSKKLWPAEGSWEFAIEDYRLRKAAGLNFIDLGLPAGAEAASLNKGPKSEEDASAEGSEGSGGPQDTAAAAQSPQEESAAQAAPTSDHGEPPSRQIDHEEIAKEKRQFGVAIRRARARCSAHLAGRHQRVRVINHAGSDRAGWRNLWRDNKTGHALWEMDLTGGRVPLNERNACLSRKSKDYIVAQYLRGNTVTDIAEVFRIRQQRVMAIIALHMVEQRSKAQGLPMHDHFRLMMEGDYVVDEDGDYVHSGIDPCFEAVGSGERHVKILPRAPHYERKKKDAQGRVIPRDWTKEEEEIAAGEEKLMVKEFADKLAHNLGLLGGKLHRNTARDKPSRPKGGYGLLVRDLGAPAEVRKAGEQSAEAPKRDCFVALPNGHIRELNADEKYMQYSKRIRARRKY